MGAYVARRLLLVVPTLLGIMIVNFAVVQVAPGGPVEQTIARIKGQDSDATERFSGGGSGETGGGSSVERGGGGDEAGGSGRYRGARGLSPAIIAKIERMYGFDKPPRERFVLMMKRYLVFDFGESYFSGRSVVAMVRDRLPVSISLGLWATLLVYLVSIPLGIAKAVRDGSRFDVSTSTVVVTFYAIPGFLLAILLIVLLAGGSFWKVFPLRGLVSPDWEAMAWPQRIADYFWHLALPVTALVIGGFARLTLLTKNSFLDEMHKQYVTTARAKGLAERRVLYGHVFRNAMLVVIGGFPAALIGIFFTGSLLIEIIFSIEGLGLLAYESAIQRDYPVLFGTLYVSSLLGLLVRLLGDITYMLVDPRIDFEARQA